jgi:hypothetical protein
MYFYASFFSVALLKILSYNNPIVHLLLLGWIFLLRLPAFHPGYFARDESIYLLCARRMVSGGIMYVDAWDHKPPVIYWIYTLFQYCFGSWSLFFIRIATCLYLFWACWLFNQILLNYRISRQFSIMGAALLAFIYSTPWYTLELNGELLLLLPMLLICNRLISFGVEEKKHWESLFEIGILLGLCITIKLQAAFFCLSIFFAYITITTPKLSEITTLVGGILVWLLACVLILFYRGAWSSFWDIGFLYNFDYIRIGKHPGETVSWLNIIEVFKFWGLYVVLGLLGFITFRLQYFRTVIRQRRVEIIFGLWLLFSLPVVLLGGKRLYLHYFLLTMPPLLFYTVYLLKNFVRMRFQYPLVFLGMLYPLIIWVMFYFVSSAERYAYVAQRVSPNGWAQTMFEDLNGTVQEKALRSDLARYDIKKGIWITKFEPELYFKLGYPCAVKYTHFSMLFYKMNWLTQNRTAGNLVSKPERIADMYRTFSKEKPEYVIDWMNVFGEIINTLPLLMNDYQQDTIAGIRIYRLKSLAKKSLSS